MSCGISLILIFLMINYIDHLSLCFFVIHIAYLAVCLFRSFTQFITFFLLLSFEGSLYILDISPFSEM